MHRPCTGGVMKRSHNQLDSSARSPGRVARRSKLSLSKLSASTPEDAQPSSAKAPGVGGGDAAAAGCAAASSVPHHSAASGDCASWASASAPSNPPMILRLDSAAFSSQSPDKAAAGSPPPPGGSFDQVPSALPSAAPCGSQHVTLAGEEADTHSCARSQDHAPIEVEVEGEAPVAVCDTESESRGDGQRDGALEACPVCGVLLGFLDTREQEEHLNACLDAGAHSSSAVAAGGPASAQAAAVPPAPLEEFGCPMCSKDLTGWGESRRAMHINRCLESAAGTASSPSSLAAVFQPASARGPGNAGAQNPAGRGAVGHAPSGPTSVRGGGAGASLVGRGAAAGASHVLAAAAGGSPDDFQAARPRAADPCPSCGKDLASASGTARVAHVQVRLGCHLQISAVINPCSVWVVSWRYKQLSAPWLMITS